MSKFTPGPWWVEKIRHSHGLYVDANQRGICQMVGKVNPEREANARLIAAAPEMYELIRFILNYLEDRNETGGRLDAWCKDILRRIDPDWRCEK